MDDAALVSGIERVGDLARDLQGVIHRQRAVDGQAMGQCAALHELEDERAEAIAFLDAMDRRNARMIERGEDSGFAIEAGQTIGVSGERLWQDLEGDVAVQPRVAGAIDLTHATGADRLDYFVRTEARTGR
jgi:hypothetical protein